MKAVTFLSLLATFTFAVPYAVAPTLGQNPRERAVEQYACKDIMRETGSNREVAIAFLHGFLLGKSGGSKFNIESLQAQADAFVDRCLDNPAEKAVDAMLKVK